MKANELRVGNFVLFNGDIMGVDGIGYRNRVFLGGNNQPNDVSELLPIPLTPAILEKCFFVKKGLKTVDAYKERSSMMEIELYKKKYYLRGLKMYPVGLEYLHQLQNLYYSLVGEELQISL